MKTHELLSKVLEETYLLSSAIEAKNMDMVVLVLDRREEWIQQILKMNKQTLDETSKELLMTFETQNQLCMEKLKGLKEEFNHELTQVKAEKNKTIRKQKVHDSYSNPYVGSVGTSFDLKK